ncbi:MAG: glycoside hydrolase family 13 protein [Oscillospiraceae bacterium]|nr:glycoside hydrolase family 13 protein [Oscillospiraceae bacterium]
MERIENSSVFERVSVLYGGSYSESWNSNYRLDIRYEGQKMMPLKFHDGVWTPVCAMPETAFAKRFFSAAADARVAVTRYLAGGMTAENLSELSPARSRGAVFASEAMRILMDEAGQPLEMVWLAAEPSFVCELTEEERAELNTLQPRTAAVYDLLCDLIRSLPAIRHDLRLKEYRSPFGAVRTGEALSLSVRGGGAAIRSAVLELYGDALWSELPMQKTETGWSITMDAPEASAALWYRFRLQAGEKTWWLCAGPDGIHGRVCEDACDGFRLTVYDRDFETPDWFPGGVMYQIFPDRFAFSDDGGAEHGIEYHVGLGQTPELHRSLEEEPRWQPRDFEKEYSPDDFYGGRLSAICEKLPYLKGLGVTCIYLNPIVEARSNHRYDTSDYRHVDPILGSNADFENLCREARRCGIRILCDGVFSHTGADSVYFNRDGHYPEAGACQPEPSPWDSWYDFRHFPDDYRSWWGFRDLPEVNEEDPSWQAYIVRGSSSIVRQWLRHGASGWRLDVADELPDDVLHLIRSSAKEEKPDALILGEVWEDAVLKESYGSRRRYALGDSLDSVMNYPFRGAVLGFLHGHCSAFDLAAFLSSQQLHYPQPLYRSLMNLLGTHDTERLQNVLASDAVWKDKPREEQLALEASLTAEDWNRAMALTKLAAAIQFSVPGVPSIYYGDEQGMRGTNDPFNRRPYREGNPELCEYIRQLGQNRQKYAALREGDARFVAAGADVLMILRFTDNEHVLTVVNRAPEQRPFAIELDGCRARGRIDACSAVTMEL